ncbi:hypothetical protein LCGC14_2003000 [marine sediment metagenome]|uniref:Uncharacterized protein n=1 Tax=marine sediment metagenome TaxID=412755 RepID=A0A0F9HZP5_9ZZZZ
MKVRSDSEFTVVYKKGEPLAAWSSEECVLEIEASLTEDDLKDVITELLSLLHEYLQAETMPLPSNPANIPYRRN